ncbi:MAG: DNA-processing protein DprA [Pseudomonadota bacterium]|nr:DNA-processing protein DprA [Pseudomonadota bacterium]
MDPAQITALRGPAPTGIEATAIWLRAPGHHLLGWRDADYPALLQRCPNPPLVLFVAGDPAVLWHPSVAVVGSRSSTPAGQANASAFATALAESGLGVSSGMAAGIDTAAHRAALAAGGVTVAVLGTGPDVAYPHGNRGLHARIVAEGAVVSEHPPGTGPRREHFPSRNRILAGLTLGTLVVEAAHRSGALITARLAADSGRSVFAIPGSIHNPMARGCHRLIRDGALLVETPQEVTGELAAVAQVLADALRERLAAPTEGSGRTCTAVDKALPHHPLPPQTDPFRPRGTGPGGDPAHYKLLWEAVGHDPTGMDELVLRTELTTAQVSSMLLLMELEGRVATQHGRYFRCR